MSKKQKKIPAVRFPEFDDEWEVKRLGDISELITKGTTPRNFSSEGVNYVKIECLNGTNIIRERCLFISEEAHFNELKRSILQNDDILFAIAGATVGKIGLVTKDILPANTNQALAIIRLKNKQLKNYIIFTLSSKRMKKYIFESVSVGAQPNLNLQQINDFTFVISKSIEEQQKIATFLTSVDKRIQALEQKKELLEQYKKGVMQKIFSREIRFQPGTVTHHLPLAAEPTTVYNSNNSYPDWEVKKLGEIAVKESSNISANTLQNNTGNFKIYGATGFLQNVDFFRQEEEYISIVKDGAGVGRTLLCEEKSSVLGTLDIIKPKKEVNLYFLYSVLNNINFTKYVTGSTIPHIYFKDYSKQKIEIPCLEEQQKIAGFLGAIDTKIEAVTSQIDHSKTFKKGLLQKMFV